MEHDDAINRVDFRCQGCRKELEVEGMSVYTYCKDCRAWRNPDACPYCLSDKVQGADQPRHSLRGGFIEFLVACTECKKEFVQAYKFEKSVPLHMSTRYETREDY